MAETVIMPEDVPAPVRNRPAPKEKGLDRLQGEFTPPLRWL